MQSILRFTALMATLVAGPSLALAQPVRPPRPPTVPAAPVAPAAQPSEAEVRFQRGTELFNIRNFDGALAEFQRSYELSGEADLLYNLGRTYLALGRNPEAARAIDEYLRRAANLTPARRAEIEALLAQTRSFIARIDVSVEPAEVSAALSLDGEVVPLAQRLDGLVVGPGRHTVEARAEGWQPASETVLLASGDRRAVRLELRRVPESRAVTVTPVVAPPTPRPPPRVEAPSGLHPRWFVVGAATTGVFLIAGAVFGALTSSAHDDYVTRYRDEYSLPEVADMRDRGETMRLLTNVSFGLAAAAGVATVVLFTQTRFRRASSATVSLLPTPNGGAARLQIVF